MILSIYRSSDGDIFPFHVTKPHLTSGSLCFNLQIQAGIVSQAMGTEDEKARPWTQGLVVWSWMLVLLFPV